MRKFLKPVVRRGHHALASSALLLLIFPLANARADESFVPKPGEIAEIVCAADSSQSYALYLPSSYTPAKNSPIIYFFDPGGRGRRPLALYKDIADKYGFILAGSNNSRNFSSDQSKSVNAIWLDTHAHLAIDPHRIYTSGFSGGARVAGAMALSCAPCQIAGVIAHGAGYPSNQSPLRGKMLYFFAVGDHDFNWPEVMTVRRDREDHAQPYRVRVFAGPHQWAPPEVMEDAMQWIILRSMQSGDLPRDQGFIERRFEQVQQQAKDAEKGNNILEELAAYRSLASDFDGLKNVADAQEKLADLKGSSSLKAALKKEDSQIEEQFSLERAISPRVRAYVNGTSSDLNALRLDILQAMAGLKSEADHARDETRRLVAGRALEDLWVEAIENGQQELQAGHFEKAETCFDLMSQVRNDPWPFLLLARTHAAAGKSKRAIADLQQAVRTGFKDADVIASDEQLQSLSSDASFQKLLLQMKQTAAPK